jgi:hypothetical protein
LRYVEVETRMIRLKEYLVTVFFGGKFKAWRPASFALTAMLWLNACGPMANNDSSRNLTETPNHRTGFCLGEQCSTANGDMRIDGHREATQAEFNEIFQATQDPERNTLLAQSVTDLTFLRYSQTGNIEMLGSHRLRLEIQAGLDTLVFEKTLSISENGGLYEFSLTPAAGNPNYKLMGYFADVYMGMPGEESNVKTFGTFHLVKFAEGQFDSYTTIDIKAYVGRIRVRTQVESGIRQSEAASEISRFESSLAWVLDLTVSNGRSFYHYDFIDVPPSAPEESLESQIASQLSFWGNSLDTSELVGDTLPTSDEDQSVTGLPVAASPLSERFTNVRGWGEGPPGPAGSRIMVADFVHADGVVEEVAFQIQEEAPLTADQQQRIVRPEQFYTMAREHRPVLPPADGAEEETGPLGRLEPIDAGDDLGDEGDQASEPAAPVQLSRIFVAAADESGAVVAPRPGLYVSAGQLTPAFQIGEEPPLGATAPAPVTGDEGVVDAEPDGRRLVTFPRLDRDVVTGIVRRVQAELNGALVRPGGGQTAPVIEGGDLQTHDPNAIPDRVQYSYIEHSSDPASSFLSVDMTSSRVRDAMLKFDRYYEKPYIQKTIKEILAGYGNETSRRNRYDLMMMRNLKYGNPFRGMIEDAFEGWDTPSIFAYRSLWESRFFRDPEYPNNETNANSTARGLGQFLAGTAGGSTVRMRVGNGWNDERRFVAPSLCGMAKYFNYFMDYFPHDPTLGFLAYHSGEGSKRRTDHAGVQGYARDMLGGLDAVRARNYAFTYHELIEANVIPQHKEDWANNSIATAFILQNPQATYSLEDYPNLARLADRTTVILRQPDRRMQISDIVDDMRFTNSDGTANHKVFHPTLPIHDQKCEQAVGHWREQFPLQ